MQMRGNSIADIVHGIMIGERVNSFFCTFPDFSSRTIRQISDAVVMSGDFIQRGAPAIYSKFLRTRSALLSGADLVVEMPVFGSLSAAQDFARCGISLFHHMGIIDVLSFGSEVGEIEKLQELADQAGTETEEQSDLIRKSLRSGLTYPQALALARKDSVPVSPNDILAVEYLKALKEFSSAVEPM